jgi:hypothetical protein
MKENTTSGNQLGTRLICGLLTGVLGLVSATAVFAVSQQLQGKAELALQEIWSSLLLAFAGAFIFGAAAPGVCRRLLIKFALSSAAEPSCEDDVVSDFD